MSPNFYRPHGQQSPDPRLEPRTRPGDVQYSVPNYPYSPIAALGQVDANEAKRLAAEMSGVTALGIIAAGGAGYGLAVATGRNRGEAIQAAVAGWVCSFAIHWLYHMARAR